MTSAGASIRRVPPRGWVAVLVIGPIAAAIAVVAGSTAILLLVLGAVMAFGFAVMPGVLFAAYLLIPFYKAVVQPYSPIDITVLLALLNVLQIVPIILDRRPRHLSRVGIALWVALALLILAGALWAPIGPVQVCPYRQRLGIVP